MHKMYGQVSASSFDLQSVVIIFMSFLVDSSQVI